ncbi:MAG: hypothetical protein M3Z30_10790 [Gemmatimonadota bacterium]|nr:hypothetical protein [Gemmatimonadota bacterium]
MKNDNPYGDDAGTRVGKPDTPKRDNPEGNLDGDLQGAGDGGNLGAGKEATGGLSQHGNPGGERPSSVPPERNEESDSGYGGKKGGSNKSGDQR